MNNNCCKETELLLIDFQKLMLSITQLKSNNVCCQNLKRLRKYFNMLLIEIGNDNLKNNFTELRKSKRLSVKHKKKANK